MAQIYPKIQGLDSRAMAACVVVRREQFSSYDEVRRPELIATAVILRGKNHKTLCFGDGMGLFSGTGGRGQISSWQKNVTLNAERCERMLERKIV